MSGNTSATGGFLTPTTPLPADGASFDALIQALVSGITGLDGSLVRPRFQASPPEQPPQNVDWCAVGEVDSDRIGMPYLEFTDSDTGGSATQTEWDEVTVLTTFYGPNSLANARLLRAGLYLSQNRETLKASGLGFTEAGKATRLPELVNQIWMDRTDMTLMFQRVTNRTYNILSVLSALQSTTNGTITSPP